ncbi:MAG: hypothetical protein WBV28_11825, partial [Terracidiphilus sp.]
SIAFIDFVELSEERFCAGVRGVCSCADAASTTNSLAVYRNAISTFPNDLHVLELTQPVNDATTRQGFVVND